MAAWLCGRVHVAAALCGWTMSACRYRLTCSAPWPGNTARAMIFFGYCEGLAGGALNPLAFYVDPDQAASPRPSQGYGPCSAITARDARPRSAPNHWRLANENYGWEYIFYINVVPGLLMISGPALRPWKNPLPAGNLLPSRADYAGILNHGPCASVAAG